MYSNESLIEKIKNNKLLKIILISSGVLVLFLIIFLSIFLSSKSNKKTTTKTPWEKYLSANKYLYIWEYFPHNYTLNMIKDHHFSRVYLSIGCIETFWDKYFSKGKLPGTEIGSIPHEEMIAELNKLDVEVELVTFLAKDPGEYKDVDRTIQVANIVKNLTKTLKIKALHFDQEPSDYWSYEHLLKMYRDLNKIFPTSAILRPFWLDIKMSDLKNYFDNSSFYEEFSDCETLVDAIMKVTNLTDLMAYSKDYEKIDEYMATLKTMEKRHKGQEAKNVIEIAWAADVPENDTLHQRYVEDKDKLFEFIYNKTVQYGAITIHYFEMWYKTLYCYWPSLDREYLNGYPLNCTWNQMNDIKYLF